MELTMHERLALLGVLPKQGTFVELTIIGNLRARLDPSESDLEDFGITTAITPEGQITTIEAPPERTVRDIDVTDRAAELVVGVLKARDTAGTLQLQDVSLYAKFVGMPEIVPDDVERAG